MRKIIAFIILLSLSFVFGCSSDKKKTSDKITNAFRVGVKYACPLKILTENIIQDKIYVYLDGGNSYVNPDTGKWTGNGAHFVFVMNRTSGNNIPTGTFSIGEEILEASYCEDFNNDGPNYNAVINLKDGILVSSYTSGEYTFDFSGIDTQDSTVVMNFCDGISYIFDNTKTTPR